MAPHATDVLVVPVLLSKVRAVKQEDGGDIGDEGRGSRRDGSRPLQPMQLHIVAIDISDEGLIRSDEVEHGFVVAEATGQHEAAIALEMRKGAPPSSPRSALCRDPGRRSD